MFVVLVIETLPRLPPPEVASTVAEKLWHTHAGPDDPAQDQRTVSVAVCVQLFPPPLSLAGPKFGLNADGLIVPPLVLHAYSRVAASPPQAPVDAVPDAVTVLVVLLVFSTPNVKFARVFVGREFTVPPSAKAVLDTMALAPPTTTPVAAIFLSASRLSIKSSKARSSSGGSRAFPNRKEYQSNLRDTWSSSGFLCPIRGVRLLTENCPTIVGDVWAATPRVPVCRQIRGAVAAMWCR